MSFLAKLIIEEEEMNVLECNFDFTQNINPDGSPAGMPRIGLIHVLIESTASLTLLEWMIMPDSGKEGRIDFYKRDVMSTHKSLHFIDGFCISYQEIFNGEDALPMKTRIAISSRCIDVNDNVSYETNWQGFN